MRKLSCFVAASLIVAMGASDAFADAEAGQGYFSAMGSYIDDDQDRLLDDGVNGGQLNIGYAINEHWNIEGMLFAAIPDFTDTRNGSQDHLGFGLDVQRVFMRSERFSPYLHAGLGHLNIESSNSSSSSDAIVISGGAGFLLDMFSSNVALRGEWKYRFDEGPNSLADNLYSVGLQIPFGAATPKFVDTDRDGVNDDMDRCPNTPAGARVDAYGCEVDSDGDGVKDSMDKCPGTPAGIRVDASGCPVDSDGDGVTDDKDKCPGTPAGASVDADGCEMDGDNDGVVDRLDECPDSAEGAQVDIKGCEIKEEITLRGVNFQSNSDVLVAGAESVLSDAAATLRKNPSITVEVAGHTDSDGAADYNEGLSARRAQTVYDYLARNGIAENRMSVRGYGEAQPIADNTTAAGKAENRRVVLRILER
ncbi:MAG: OmpA family protein [Gammaproteobacteria bacterium]|nr:OmpA family protein [Gammaproteobacteria bacterium]